VWSGGFIKISDWVRVADFAGKRAETG